MVLSIAILLRPLAVHVGPALDGLVASCRTHSYGAATVIQYESFVGVAPPIHNCNLQSGWASHCDFGRCRRIIQVILLPELTTSMLDEKKMLIDSMKKLIVYCWFANAATSPTTRSTRMKSTVRSRRMTSLRSFPTLRTPTAVADHLTQFLGRCRRGYSVSCSTITTTSRSCLCRP